MTSPPPADQNPGELGAHLAQELLADLRRLLVHPTLNDGRTVNHGAHREVTRALNEARGQLRAALRALDGVTAPEQHGPPDHDRSTVRFSLSFRNDPRLP